MKAHHLNAVREVLLDNPLVRDVAFKWSPEGRYFDMYVDYYEYLDYQLVTELITDIWLESAISMIIAERLFRDILAYRAGLNSRAREL